MVERPLMDVEDAREYSEALAQIGIGWWRQIAWAFRQRIPDALDLSRREWAEKYHGYLKLPIAERREAVAELAADGLNNSEIADALGVAESTVRNDRLVEAETAQDAAPPMSDSQNCESDMGPAVEPSAQDSQNCESDMGPAESSAEPEPPPLVVAEPLVPTTAGWHRLGDHLLYCGDSADEEFIAACQGAFAFADPPYNAGKAEWDAGFVWNHDYLAEAVDIVAVTPGIASLGGFLANTKMPYQWSMSAEITNGMTRGALGFGNWICVTLFARGSIYRSAKDHVRIPAATGDDRGGSHPSRKPIRLMTHLIELFTTKGDTVVDPFLGSGTTLLAAERTGRRCIGAELDPVHCAEIIARYGSRA